MTMTDTTIRPFEVHVPDEDLADLRRRVAATNWPEKETVADQSQGAPLAMIQELAHIIPYLGAMPLGSITPDTVREWRATFCPTADRPDRPHLRPRRAGRSLASAATTSPGHPDEIGFRAAPDGSKSGRPEEIKRP